MKKTLLIVATASALALSACSDSDGGDTSKVSVSVTDAPVDEAAKVVVEFNAIELKPADAGVERFEFDEPRQIDLLALQNGVSEPLLTDEEVPAGSYNWVRLYITDDQGLDGSYLEGTDGGIYTLIVPSGSQSGLKLNNGFVLPAGGESDFTIDFDLRKSVTNPGGNSLADYLLKPSLRLVDNAEVGVIEGQVDTALITDASCTSGTAVYVYSGLDQAADDVGSAAEPIVSASVAADESGLYVYTLAFMAAGDYTVAFTCQSADDDPEVDDAVAFSATSSATVSTGQTTIIDLP